MLLELLFGKATLLRQALAAFGQLDQGDHLSLVCFKQTAIGAVHPVHARADLLVWGLVPGLCNVSFGDEPLELSR